MWQKKFPMTNQPNFPLYIISPQPQIVFLRKLLYYFSSENFSPLFQMAGVIGKQPTIGKIKSSLCHNHLHVDFYPYFSFSFCVCICICLQHCHQQCNVSQIPIIAVLHLDHVGQHRNADADDGVDANEEAGADDDADGDGDADADDGGGEEKMGQVKKEV